MSVLPVPHLCLVPEDNKEKVSDPVELELGIVVNHHVGPEN